MHIVIPEGSAGPCDINQPDSANLEPEGQQCQLVFRAWRYCSYWWSTAVLIFALVVLYYDICMDWVGDFDDNSQNSTDFNSTPIAVNVIVGTLLLFWVAILEGAQCSIVGLSSVNIETFKTSHPQAYRTCKWLHAGPNLEKFIVGRQFLLLFIIFMITKLFGHSRDRQWHEGVDRDGANYNNGDFYMGTWQWHRNADLAFLQNSILLMIVIIVPGALVSQLLATGKMLDFLEARYYAYYTVAIPSMAMEWIGLTHSAYLMKDLVAWLAGEQQDPKSAQPNDAFHYFRCFYSLVTVIFAMFVVFYGLLNGKTNCWHTLPGGGALALALFFLFFIGCCEGFQIAAMKLTKLPSHELKKDKPVAYKVVQRLFAGTNLQRFLVGRQVFVAMMMVLLGRVTSFKNGVDVWGMDKWVMDGFLETGILGAVFVVNVGQLSFRMLASAFPTTFINNYVTYGLLEIALAVESTGVVNSCWPLAWGLDSVLGLKEDPVFDASNAPSEEPVSGDPIKDRMNDVILPPQDGSRGPCVDLHQPGIAQYGHDGRTRSVRQSSSNPLSRALAAKARPNPATNVSFV